LEPEAVVDDGCADDFSDKDVGETSMVFCFATTSIVPPFPKQAVFAAKICVLRQLPVSW
jgi:hypothetical protein